MTGQKVVLSDKDVDAIQRLKQGKYIDGDYDPYQVKKLRKQKQNRIYGFNIIEFCTIVLHMIKANISTSIMNRIW